MRVTQEELAAAAVSARKAADIMLNAMERAMQDQEDARARAAMRPPLYESEDVPKGTPLRNAATGAIYVHPDDARWAEAIARGWKRTESGWTIPELLLQPVACYGGQWRAGVGLAGLFQDFPSEETALRAALDNPRYKREGDT